MKSTLILLVAGMVALSGCNSRVEKNPPNPVTSGKFGQIQAKILIPKCVSCHSGGSPADGIDLSTYAGTVSAKSINVAAPEKSPLYTSVLSGKMPKNRERLENSEIELILTWIKEGAKENDDPQTPPAPAPKATATFGYLSKNFFGPKCVVCHNAAKPRGKVDLATYEGLINSKGGEKLKPIEVGNAEKSSLYVEMREAKMPPTPKMFTVEEIEALRVWILTGAKEKTTGVVLPGPGQPNPPQPNYEWLSKNLLNRRCGSCHGIPFTVAKVDFTTYHTLLNSTGKDHKALVPGDPSQSGIYLEVASGHMPPKRKEISADELKLVKEWIEKGAQNN